MIRAKRVKGKSRRFPGGRGLSARPHLWKDTTSYEEYTLNQKQLQVFFEKMHKKYKKNAGEWKIGWAGNSGLRG
jgi:hypothetical protein